MKKLGMAVWSLTMIGVTTVGVGVLCAASWVNGLMTAVVGLEKKNQEETNDPPAEEDETTEGR